MIFEYVIVRFPYTPYVYLLKGDYMPKGFIKVCSRDIVRARVLYSEDLGYKSQDTSPEDAEIPYYSFTGQLPR